MTDKVETKRINLYLPADLYEQAKAISVNKGMNFSAYMAEVIQDTLNRNKD